MVVKLNCLAEYLLVAASEDQVEPERVEASQNGEKSDFNINAKSDSVSSQISKKNFEKR